MLYLPSQLLDVGLERLGPGAGSLNVEADVVVKRRGCDAERVPLQQGKLGDVQEAVLARPAEATCRTSCPNVASRSKRGQVPVMCMQPGCFEPWKDLWTHRHWVSQVQDKR